jgi:hypothetical protein
MKQLGEATSTTELCQVFAKPKSRRLRKNLGFQAAKILREFGYLAL